MINENWMRSIAKSYQQLNEINEAPLAALEGSSMTVSGKKGRRGLKDLHLPMAGNRSMETHFYNTGAYHAEQGLDPHPNGVDNPHYMAGYNSVKQNI